jgi:hypothetical protein
VTNPADTLTSEELKLMSDETLAELYAMVGKGIIGKRAEGLIVAELERRELESWWKKEKKR